MENWERYRHPPAGGSGPTGTIAAAVTGFLNSSSWMIASWFANTLKLPLRSMRGDRRRVRPRILAAALAGVAPGLSAHGDRALGASTSIPRRSRPRATTTSARALFPIARAHARRALTAAYDGLAVRPRPRMQQRLSAYHAARWSSKHWCPGALAEAERRPPHPTPAGARRVVRRRAPRAALSAGNLGRATRSSPFSAWRAACRAAVRQRHLLLLRGARLPGTRATCGGYLRRHQRAVRTLRGRERVPGAARGRGRPPAEPARRSGRESPSCPSKFFGSLAVGRPVLYAGPADSEVAVWIAQHDVGLCLPEPASAGRQRRRPSAAAASTMRWTACTPSWPGPRTIRRPCAAGKPTRWPSHHREFSKRVVNDRWDALCVALVASARAGMTPSQAPGVGPIVLTRIDWTCALRDRID